jgi:hypothetical protein
MEKRHLLAIDAGINLLLGLIFILMPNQMIILLGADFILRDLIGDGFTPLAWHKKDKYSINF